MNRFQMFSVCLMLLFSAYGCGEKSADELFKEGEHATHDMASYPIAEKKLSEFLELFPDDPRADVALQALARVLMNQGKNKEAIARYETLIERFPKSRYCPQAQFMIGYIYDQSGDQAKAKVAYKT